MRPSTKRSLTGILVAGVLASSAVGADARGGGCGSCYFIGITPAPGGSPEGGGFQGGGFQANTGHGYGHIRRHGQEGYGGYGYGGGYYSGH
jgi:hypothetical protein